MTTLTLTALLLSFSALCLSTVALFAALRSSGRTLSRRLDELSTRFSAVEDHCEAQTSRIKSIRAQVNAANSSRSANREPPELTSATIEARKDQWQRETNLKIATGQIRVPGR
jgi:hypothetical protein